MAMSCPGLDSKWVRAPGQSLPKPCERAGQTRQRPVTKAADTDSEAPTASAERLHAGLRAVAGAVVIASASSVFAQPAAAWSSNGSHKFHEWKPRRHHRRLEDRERSVTLGPNPKDEEEAPMHEQLWEAAEEQAGGWGERFDSYRSLAGRQARSFRDQLQRLAASEDSPSHIADTSAASRGYTLQSRSQAVAASPLRHLPGNIPRPQTGLGWAVLALVIAGLSKSMFGWQLPRWMQGGQGRAKGGRWIQDRSLGGKLVFIPDEEVTPSRKQEPFSDWKVSSTPQKTPGTAEAAGRAESGAEASTSASLAFGAGPQAAAQQQSVGQLPQWWDPPPATASTASFKEEAQRRAQLLTRTMEERKVGGLDPSLDQLVALREICAEMQIVVRTRTMQGRDSLLRIAADGAIKAAMTENLLMLNGIRPQRLIAGLAVDLGIPDTKAGTIATGAVAAQLSRELFEVCVAVRGGRKDEMLMQLTQISCLLRELPLGPGSAEAAMVGNGLESKASLEERQAVFNVYGVVYRPTAGLMAELLGFNPELVLPHLDKELQAASFRPGT
ncbi:hypothetical protein WJX84_002488 [Apatococcus fuscideae]|uniref:Uncharacterized protein n=1 Tax=Apatococcus fuscideae TaxID=2026836 RepID=A0AAW1T0A1_9CHLO